MLEYIGTDKEAPGVNVTGWFYGNPDQLLLQLYAALFIIALNVVATCVILKVVSIFVPLRQPIGAIGVGLAQRVTERR